MAKKNEQQKTTGGIAALAKKIGATTLDRVETNLGFITTTNLALNYICSGRGIGGGIPMGRITEIFGPSSACKTAFATHIIQGCQSMGGVCVLIDSEHAYSKMFAERLGISSDNLIYDGESRTLEECFAMIIKFAKAFSEADEFKGKPALIVYDSIAASPSAKEFDEMVVRQEDNKAETGTRAKVCGQKLRNISQFLADKNIALVIINQLRTNIGVMYGNPEVTAGGGKALEYYGSLRLDIRRRKKIEKSGVERSFGVHVDAKTVKNKVHDPFWEAKGLQFFFDRGVDPLSGYLEACLFTGRFVSQQAGYASPADDPTNKFRKSQFEAWSLKDDNFKYFDASSREELERIYAMNAAARAAAGSDEFTAVDADDDAGDAVSKLPTPQSTSMTG